MPKHTKKTREQHALEHIGLTPNEATLYLILVKNPQSTVQSLQRISPFPRTLLYSILTSLESRGIVTSVKQQKKLHYTAEDPSTLHDVLDEKKQEFNQARTEIEKLIPKLKNQYQLARHRPGVRVFEGVPAYRSALEDVLATRPKYVHTFAYAGETPLPGVDLRNEMRARQAAAGTEERILVFSEDDKIPPSSYTGAGVSYRRITQNIASPDTELRLYGGKLVYMSPTDGDPVVTIIEDQHLFSMQRNIFDWLWETGKPLI